MGFRCGIVGLPNVGKSTLFNALTRAGAMAANYPFCTIDPNVGVVPVPDPRLDRLASLVKPQRVVPTTIEFVDIAGLVSGASRGEGLGNRFLGHIREVDAIAHVVRCFEDPDVSHVAGGIHPLRDIETINTELILADLETVERAAMRAEKMAKTGEKHARLEHSWLRELQQHLDAGRPARTWAMPEAATATIGPLHLLTSKPVLYVANVDEGGFRGNPHLDAVRAVAVEEGAAAVPVSAAIESTLAEMAEAERAEFLEELGLEEAGLARVIRAGYELLGLITFFTAGPKEARAWTVRDGTLAPQAAGTIHTDFERGFIRAEVIAFEDYDRLGGEAAARDAGRLRLEGRDYVVQDGDVVHFRFNV